MAKETTIIFVYDTEKLKREEDDPATAILYFHPTWVSDQQKTALCGQIIGTITCLKSIFTSPRIVSLQTGKFFIIENGQFILAVGTDRNIADWLLEHRANLLHSLVTFFNKDFIDLSRIYKNEALSAKLYHLFETYLRMLFFGSNIFNHIPMLCLPKSSSNVFTEAMVFLEACREFSHVLGGTILYHNKVVATQLSTDITKRIVIADPYRIKSPAELGKVDFNLPLGVQLLQVYIPNKDFCDLLETSLRNRCVFQYLNNKEKHHFKPPAETSIVSNMKRDQSLLLTAVPEEGGDASPLGATFVPAQKKSRPKFLNLKCLSLDSSESKVSTKTTPITPFLGQTSIASTPMTELKRFVLQDPLTIVNKECQEGIQGDDCKDDSPKFKQVLKQGNSLLDLTEVSNSITQYSYLKNKLDLSPKKRKGIQTSKSIHDPLFPLLNVDGTAISYNLFEEQLKNDSNRLLYSKKISKNSIIFGETHPQERQETDNTITNATIQNESSKEHRKSLTLPLKSGNSSDISSRKMSSGVQLTPLMSKLSKLAFEDRAIRDATPMTPLQPNLSFMYKMKEVKNLLKVEDENMLQRCILFVCGQQDVVLTLLVREECCKDEEVISKLWELCTEHLVKLEKQLNFCLESQSSGTSTQESEPYSFLCLHSRWDTVKRGGPWGTGDLSALITLHRDFRDVSDVTEILMRGTDNVVYGYRCGASEVYYQESACVTSGLPPPSDPIGLVQMKAKRRLERDHAVVLL